MSSPAGAAVRVGAADPSPLWIKLLWVANLLVSAYLTWEHYNADVVLVCPEGDFVNCASVTTSPWAYLLGIPVALLGLLYNIAGVAFAFAGRRLGLRRGRLVGLVFTGVGMLFVLYLVWAEFVMIGQICSWCTVVHVITAVLFVFYLTTFVAGAPEPADEPA
ncbi:vitamin K epoxide reductase family protein [Propioniciclava sp. MC1595]|uniref:vitamin K epoxide reductase family protein n=1 Tax=Propioniciclava sp. MC1595 TaxID=2760308 RepID=UPI001AA0EAB1|nr:vitamin K epoxide reductase family protein [Propioniciclava sp. MC1595]QTE26771.1 vitamin K epoxide reductase family protein [Propioniciclava sp. MC1595]